MDALSVVVDEVALEGLDGITLPSLWIRLEDRKPKFPLKLDDCTKGFIWRSLVNNADLSFHELPEEREDIQLLDRFKDIDPETGCETQEQKFSHDRRDVYPLHVVPENQDGIQGSCVFFKERKNVTKQICSKSFAPLVNLEEAQERYGRKLVVVASQALRFRTLIGSDNDPETKISNDSYCVLERVGRGRWQGELQSDLHGSLFKIDARKMHYLRKCLVKHELITMQSYVRRLKTGQQQHSILLLLKRFHVNRRNKYDILMEHVSDFLLQQSDHFTTVDNLKEHLNLNDRTMKRLFKNLRYSKLVEFCQYALEDLDPSAEHCTNKNGSKVLIRCIKLLKPYGKKTPADFDDDDDDEDDDDYTEGGGRVLPPEGRIMERDVMSQAYHIISSSGPKGIPQREIGLRMNVGRLESRMICRKMDRDGVIKSFMEDEGRQRTTKFISHKSRSHETYRLLKRKNMIVEAIQSFKIIEGFFPLQKIINDAEKKDGVSSKCCKKTVLRLVHSLSREGLLKLYTTTVIQDGVTKKVDIIAHPSIQPSDGRVGQLIEQIRFRISISIINTSNFRTFCEVNKFSNRISSLLTFIVPGLGRTLGFQPKMIRLRVIHSFLWYLMYGHPLRDNPTEALSASQSPAEPSSSDPGTGLPESQAKQDDTSNPPLIDEGLVYADEDSWRRFIPPVALHKGFTSGWAMVRSLLLCLPLSVFVQIVQINYKVDELEDYLSDSVKQHYLVRALPARMKRQLLYKRKYIFIFHENLQKLAYMGLVQFGVVERFKDKDQVFVYLKRNASIVDTTTSEPHYWLVQEPPDSPFERRQYTFNTAEDVESFWFDLMCVCLNTPLGTWIHQPVIINTLHFSHVWSLRGSYEVCDNGSIPGDGRGAAGLDSELFSHLKRNWLWTCHLLASKPMGIESVLRNKLVVGGKGRTRKRKKTEVVKAPRRKKKEPKKRTRAHDATDHQALKRMTRHRVYWSVQEDSVMMLCSVASHLLNSKIKRPFVPYCVVRDLLHAEFDISKDKTSVAVGRRTRYILKNPQTLLNYRWVFSEYVRLLRQKFSTVMCDRNLVIPESQDLFVFIPHSKEDIHAIVLHNLIQSSMSMTNGQMKSFRSFQTFHTYSKYNQELLCRVFVQCKKRRMFNRRRISKTLEPKKNRGLPMLPMSFQMSQTYYRSAHFAWRFPFSLCTDSFCFMRNLITRGEQTDESPDAPDLSDMLQFPLSSPGGACLVSLSLMTLGRLSVHVSIPKQIVVVDSSLVDNEVKDESEIEDDDDDDDEDECDGRKKLQVSAHQASHTNYLLMRGYCSPGIVKLRNLNMNDNIVVESCILKLGLRDAPAHHVFTAPPLELTKSGPSLLPPILTRITLSPSYSPPTAEQCDERLVQDRRYSAQDIEACARLRRSLDEAGEKGLDERDLHVSHLHLQEAQSGRTRNAFLLQDLQEEGQVVRVGSLSVRWVLMDHADPWLLTVNCKQMSQSHVNAKRRPHLTSQYNFPFARKRCIKAMQLEAEGPPAKKHASDKEKQTDRETGADGPGKPSENDATGKPSENDGTGKPNEDDGTGKPNEDDGTGKPNEDDGTGKSSEDDGTGKPNEDDGTGKPNEDDGIGKPSENDGPGKPSEAEQENLSFISRPWRFIDGKVNRPVCKAILEAVLYHIMSQPGLTQQTLLEHYKDALQPVAVLDIVQALIELGCVTKRTLVKDPKPSLFSGSAPASRGSTVSLEEPDAVFYEPTISCCLQLCRVLPNERHWNDNLL
uniref:Ral transcription factor IIIC subunit 1 n=1 Tax=Xiphophorus maculatus TaxID=8083 RepID=M4AJV5_XIPMA